MDLYIFELRVLIYGGLVLVGGAMRFFICPFILLWRSYVGLNGALIEFELFHLEVSSYFQALFSSLPFLFLSRACSDFSPFSLNLLPFSPLPPALSTQLARKQRMQSNERFEYSSKLTKRVACFANEKLVRAGK